MSSKPFSEVPYQNYALIKRNVKSKSSLRARLSDSDLFVDPSFPPDLTSLTYVYTGDDRYEKMVFKRPKTLSQDEITFCGVGGVWNAPFPWKSFNKRDWFQAAIVVVSLGVSYLKKLIPGYRNCEQNFLSDYIGAFRFNIWRFGEWVETIVDDNLPCLQTDLLYCKAHGDPPEFWGPLLEKAYAKIMKTYESVEIGNMLNALSDLTGDICEFYTQDINPPVNLFYILYRSLSNRSMLVCWRNEKRLTNTGFHHVLESFERGSFEDEQEDKSRYLHIITATTKFPTTDGRLIEMVRLKCPFPMEPTWHGKFSDGDHISWGSVSHCFMEKYKPISCKDKDEYWMTYEDFRCNFGGLVIVSGTDPFRTEGYGVDRYYKRKESLERESRSCTTVHKPLSKSVGCKMASLPYVVKSTPQATPQSRVGPIRSIPNADIQNQNSSNSSKIVSMLLNGQSSSVNNNNNNINKGEYSKMPAYKKRWNWRRGSSDDLSNHPFSRIESIGSEKSQDGDSINGDIDPKCLAYAYRRRSTPLIGRNYSTSSLSYLTHSSFLATKTDFFRSHGSWKTIVEHRDRWQRQDCSDVGKCPRVFFSITKSYIVNEMIPQNVCGRSHIILSLTQDYRRGPIRNGQLVPIGVFIYKCKQPECKDFSKYRCVGHHDSRDEQREITARFDLEEGCYVVVPYVKVPNHEGEYLLRILGEKDALCDTRNASCLNNGSEWSVWNFPQEMKALRQIDNLLHVLATRLEFNIQWMKKLRHNPDCSFLFIERPHNYLVV